jgi:cytochrome c-type biogenesis protein CcmH
MLRPDLLPRLLAALCLSLALGAGVHAAEAQPAADDPVIEARMLKITAELRCLVCQNQTIADSHSDLAQDLRRQVREMIARGSSDQQVLDYMTARYGDFVLYRPPVKATTVLLWFGPGLLLVGALGGLIVMLRRRSRLDPALFDAEEDDPPAAA